MEAMNRTLPTWTPSDRFRKARETTGQSQEEFAAATGISRATVSNYESPSYSKRHNRAIVNMWALATSVPAWWLTDDDPPTDDGQRHIGRYDSATYPPTLRLAS